MSVIPWIIVFLLYLFIIYLWRPWLLRGTKRRDDKDRPVDHPYDDRFIIAISSTVCLSVVIAYVMFAYAMPGLVKNIGEVGDFIGGLTNPLLSFAALLVLLKTTSIQNRVIEKQLESQQSQLESQHLLTFREEFYSLRENMLEMSMGMDRQDSSYVVILYDRIQSARLGLSARYVSGDEYEREAKKFMADLIEGKDFARFALSVRRAIKHVRRHSPNEKYDYTLIIRDSMTHRERVVFLSWIHYFWVGEARWWFLGERDKAGKWLPYHFTLGINASELISDDVFVFFNKELPPDKNA